MTDEHKLEAAIAKGGEAERELRIVKEALDGYRKSLYETWQNSDPRDEKGREKLWVAGTILSHVERTLMAAIRDGHVAAKELQRIRTAGEPKKLSFLRRPI